jgi:predicted lipoprotein with Yx(FWY)xxD motif
MFTFKHPIFVVPALCIVLLLAACGSTTSASPSSSSSSSSSSAYKPAPAATSAPTQPATTSSPAVKTTSLTIGGKSVTVLTDAQGKTLYYFVPDTSQKTACTGSCAETWPPLVVPGVTKVSAATKLPGELEVYKNANGNQIIYNDHPLYTFSGDSGPGQANGQGIGNQWFVATPDLAKNK